MIEMTVVLFNGHEFCEGHNEVGNVNVFAKFGRKGMGMVLTGMAGVVVSG